MKKILFTLLACVATLVANAQAENVYEIVDEGTTTLTANLNGIPLGCREVYQIRYNYPSTDPQGNALTISGIVYIPQNVYDGTDPCDGTILYNHTTWASKYETPSLYGDSLAVGLIANPLKPNYIFVISDYMGMGASADRPQAFLCGTVNARNSLDGLTAALQMLEDKQIAKGKYLFNIGFSQGGTDAMHVAKLRDMEYKDRGITFDKTFAGGGPLDLEKMFTELQRIQRIDYMSGVALLITALQEHYHLWNDYSEVLQEPLASHIQEWILSKAYTTGQINAFIGQDSLKYVLQPQYLNADSPESTMLREKLRALSVTEGWTPDPTQKYFIEHSRHDNYVPIQSVRCIIPWMKDRGFQPSIVPGKTNLQTNTIVMKLNHLPSGAVWFIQTAAAIQLWPVVYYEGEQNRYYNNVVRDLNLMKVIKFLETMGIDLRQIVSSLMNAQKQEGSDDTSAPSFFEVLNQITALLAKADLTLSDFFEMLNDAGLTAEDLMEVYNYLTSSEQTQQRAMAEPNDDMQSPMQLLGYYEQILAAWLQQGGIDLEYDKWGR